MQFRKKGDLSDEEILIGIKAGGSEAQRVTNHLYDRYAGLIYDGIKKYRLSEEDAVDVYADAIIAVGLQIQQDKFRGDSKLKTYLFRVFYNRCLNKIRDNKAKHIDLIHELPDYPTTGKSILQTLITQEEVDTLIQYLDQLGEQCKKIILMRDYYGYSPEEIATEIGFKNARSVSSMKARCRAKLKQLIANINKVKDTEEKPPIQ